MRAATAEAAQRTRAGCRGAWSALTANLKARVSELSQINFKNLTPRHLIALLGVLLLILFVLSSFTRCVRSAVPQKESTPEGAGALPMAVDPPDAYIQ